MREVFEPEIELILENYCLRILNSESEEEIENIKQEVLVSLEEFDLDTSSIKSFFSSADVIIEKFSMEENELPSDIYAETNTEIGTPDSLSESYGSVMQGALVGGVGFTALMSVLVLKKVILNRKKKEEKNRNL